MINIIVFKSGTIYTMRLRQWKTALYPYYKQTHPIHSMSKKENLWKKKRNEKPEERENNNKNLRWLSTGIHYIQTGKQLQTYLFVWEKIKKLEYGGKGLALLGLLSWETLRGLIPSGRSSPSSSPSSSATTPLAQGWGGRGQRMGSLPAGGRGNKNKDDNNNNNMS